MQVNRLRIYLVESKHASVVHWRQEGAEGCHGQLVFGVTQHAWFISQILYLFVYFFYPNQLLYFYRKTQERLLKRTLCYSEMGSKE